MADPRLNSMHLLDERREEFRKAREALLEARGDQTKILGHEQAPSPIQAGSKTPIQQLLQLMPPGLDYAVLDQDAVYPLKVGLNTIGRLPDNDVVLQDPFVSRRHCAILVHATAGCELHDVASKNGTFLNGRRLSGPTPLLSGDEIRMCDRQLIFVRKDALSQVHDSDQTQAE